MKPINARFASSRSPLIHATIAPYRPACHLLWPCRFGCWSYFLDLDERVVGRWDVVRIDDLLAPLERMAASSSSLVSSPLETTRGAEGGCCSLPRYRLEGARGGGDPIRIGIFAGIHGDEPAGPHAAVSLLEVLQAEAALVQGYVLSVYPVCNPSGFIDGTRLSRSGKDLNREFWVNSSEPEVGLLEADIRRQRFHGLISLHADDTSDGVYGYVRGAVLTRALLEPALAAASGILSLNTNEVIDGFSAQGGIISECYEGILTSPPELNPAPFEIILETPARAPVGLQTEALVAAMRSILTEYSNLLAYAANL